MPDLLERLWREGARRVPTGERGGWQIVRAVVTEEQARENLRQAQSFGDVRYTPAGSYTSLIRGESCWMSDTPDEMEDHRECFEQVQRRGGRVLVHGLGLGLITYALLALDNVEHVDVVELDRDVIALVAPSLAVHERDGRLTIHTGDCFTFQWPRDARWSVVWHDIWLPAVEANLPEMTRLHDRFAGRCGWQDSWGRHLILRQQHARAAAGPTGVPASARASYEATPNFKEPRFIGVDEVGSD